MAAIQKVVIASFVLLSLLLLNENVRADAPVPANPVDCGGLCQVRCSLSSRPNLCHRACGTCCSRCQCVPPGTAGNYEACSCYAKMTTRGNVLKCP